LTQSIEGTGEDKRASSLVVSLDKALNGIAYTFEWLDWVVGSNRCLLDSKTEKVPSPLSPGRGTLTNKIASTSLKSESMANCILKI